MSSPVFSVVIPTHNRADRLRQAIESVLVQDYPDWELIIVDDGSTDDTERTGTAYQQLDARVRYFYQRNQQLNAARNRGVNLSRGRYVCFLDDDDYFLAHHLGVLSEYTSEAADVLLRSGQLLEREGKRVRLPNYDNDEDLLRQYWARPAGPFGMAIPRHLLQANPFPEDLLLLDDFVWLSQTLTHHDLYQIDDHTVVVRQHDEQRTATYPNPEQAEKNVQVLRKAYAQAGVAERVPASLLERQIVHQFTHLARQLNRRGDKAAARKLLERATREAGLGQLPDLLKTAGTILLQ